MNRVCPTFAMTPRREADVRLVRRAQGRGVSIHGWKVLHALEDVEDHLAYHGELTPAMREWLGEDE